MYGLHGSLRTQSLPLPLLWWLLQTPHPYLGTLLLPRFLVLCSPTRTDAVPASSHFCLLAATRYCSPAVLQPSVLCWLAAVLGGPGGLWLCTTSGPQLP